MYAWSLINDHWYGHGYCTSVRICGGGGGTAKSIWMEGKKKMITQKSSFCHGCCPQCVSGQHDERIAAWWSAWQQWWIAPKQEEYLQVKREKVVSSRKPVWWGACDYFELWTAEEKKLTLKDQIKFSRVNAVSVKGMNFWYWKLPVRNESWKGTFLAGLTYSQKYSCLSALSLGKVAILSAMIKVVDLYLSPFIPKIQNEQLFPPLFFFFSKFSKMRWRE